MDNKLAKKAFLETYARTFGNVQQACKACDIARQTYYNWKNDDPEFAKAIAEVEPEEVLLDFVESKLIQKINDGDIAAIIFVAKTKGKKRGYIERSEIDQTIRQEPINLIFPDAPMEADKDRG